jgi:hypothetical protein
MDMTSPEHADTKVPEVERIRAAIGALGLSPERLQAVSEHLAALAESRGSSVRDRIVAVTRARTEARPKARLPRGLAMVLRTAGMAWAALMLTTLTVAFATRSTARRATAAIDPDADEIRLRTALGPLAFTSRARSFRGGFVDLWYGGGFIDLREATLDADGAHLQVRAVFGGGQVVVPETWRVTARVRGIGGLRDVRPAADLPLDAPHLTITGLALFGGFAVQAELPPHADELVEAVARAEASLPAAPETLPGVEAVPAV